MSREMIVNIAEGQECRIAVIEAGSLEELYIERTSATSYVGNIYKGKVVNVEPGIQAAFVDFGAGKNGFLHISDLHPRYFARKNAKNTETIGKRKALRDRPPIQQCLRKSQELVVQVTKEGINTKGPTLTTYLSLPGRYIVMMPWMHKLGVSQKIEDEQERDRLKKILESIEIPENSGFILRTASSGCSKREVQRDISYISRLWKAITKRMDKVGTPAELYRESDLVIRAMRDVFNARIERVICDSEAIAKKIRDFLAIVQPRMKKRVTFYDGKVPLFHKYRIEEEIRKIQSRQVKLKSGGSIVIEQTEALVAIDVNSGSYRKHSNAEQTALKINIEAANEIVRQLKLRDLGGLIICDFIDMRDSKNRREVEKAFRMMLRDDKARSRILKISSFGVIEMTRQRVRPSLQSSTFLVCPHCGGTGMVKSHETGAIEVLRMINTAAAVEEIKKIEISVSPDVALFLQNFRRSAIAKIEFDEQKQIIIIPDDACKAEQINIVCYDERHSVVKF